VYNQSEKIIKVHKAKGIGFFVHRSVSVHSFFFDMLNNSVSDDSSLLLKIYAEIK